MVSSTTGLIGGEDKRAVEVHGICENVLVAVQYILFVLY